MTNLSLSSPPAVRQISGRCVLNGHRVPFVSFSVEDTAYRGASVFDLKLAISALPAEMSLLSWWAKQKVIRTELTVCVGEASGTRERKLITGEIDQWHYTPGRFAITAEGRDLTARLIDAKVTGESFRNMTCSEIATQIATRRGLKPRVTPTRHRYGEFYQIDTAHLTGEQTEWDILTSLAGFENFIVRVEGEELYFGPAEQAQSGEDYVIRWQPPGTLAYPRCNMSDDLTFSRALTISGGVTVEVLSWNAKRKNRQFMVTYPQKSHHPSPGGAVTKGKVWRVVRNGLTPETAQTLARSLYQQIIQHEMKFTGSVAGDTVLTPHTRVRIEGTNSPFDQHYHCDRVRRTVSCDTGYTMTLSGRNHSPALEVMP